MKLPINLDKLLQPLSLFLLIALLSTGAIYAILNDEQRAKEASNLQKEIMAAIPSAISSTTKGVTWAEAGKDLLALETKRETVTQLFQERFKKPDPKVDDPNASENHTLKTLGMRVQPIVIADPSDISKISINNSSNPKIKKRKKSPCHCTTKKTRRKKH